MRYIGNILTEERLSTLPGGVLYNIVPKQEDLIPGIPTLIIGWEKTKELYPNASIIEWSVVENVYWTYGKYEKRERYENNLQKFITLTLKLLFENVNYVFYDVFSGGEERFLSFLASLSAPEPVKIIYSARDMLYIYYNGMEKVVGLSLRDCDYVDISYKKRIFSTIYNNDKIVFIKNDDVYKDTLREVRNVVRGKEFVIPYLFSTNFTTKTSKIGTF